ncbi:hypothetical protein QBC40DRAFT_239358 [Triangularia verruculosa]|uniref:Uncharacterized protein n=1 Tax=Triangularia verruculosa TaxID=2587418 RepID=A0AAN7AQJ5_9PEZI|nr:hypothetical protein QBC40DRAFT_239358 [Triangularia verruculosa]
MAQLQFYDIPFEKSARVSDLRTVLEDALKAGKCKEMAPGKAMVRDRLRSDYDEAFELLYDQLFAERAENITDAANCDPKRFVKKYFLDSHGNPDQTKTKEPLKFRVFYKSVSDEMKQACSEVPGLGFHHDLLMAFVGWEGTIKDGIDKEFARLEAKYSANKQKLHSAQADVDLSLLLRQQLAIEADGTLIAGMDTKPVTTIILDRWEFVIGKRNVPEIIVSKCPGLVMKDFGRIAVIGWDTVQVDAEIHRLKEEREREKELAKEREREAEAEEQARKEAAWNRRIAGYHRLLAACQDSPNSILGLSDLPGRYVVKATSDSLRSYSTNDQGGDAMAVNIFSTPSSNTHGVKASFHFGIVEGTMLLGMSREDVEKAREGQPKHSSYSDPGEDDGENPSDSLRAFNGIENGPTTGQKRDLGNISDPWGVRAARAKRQQMMANTPRDPNRVYFQFVCNTVHGYPEVDENNEHIGHLDFDEDAGWLKATGTFHLPTYFRTPPTFTLYKISNTPSKHMKPIDWYEFDGRRWGPGW